jgi:hypothetical protein
MGYGRVRLAAVPLGVLLLTAAYHRANSSAVMEETANRFLAALTPEQRARAVIAFDSDERLNWHFVPRDRKGLPLRDMTPAQQHLAAALLAAGLSHEGYIKAATIMSLEEVLRILEKDDGERRNPQKYYFTIFGTPAAAGVWGYRIEGHHISQNYTVVNGRVASSPSFLGANPAEVREGPRRGLRALAAEEDLGRALMESLDESQRKVALVSTKAYDDILTAANRKAALDGQPSGLSASKLNAKQFEMLMALLAEYAHNVPGQLASTREEQIRAAGRTIWFAWAGEAGRGRPHYYRVQTSAFLVEYDNTQNNANHIHTVWRDFRGDFGEDLLGAHYKAGHPRP